MGILFLGYKIKSYRYYITDFLILELFLCHLLQRYSFLNFHFGFSDSQIRRAFLVTIFFSTDDLGSEDAFPISERYFKFLRLSFTDLLATFHYLFKAQVSHVFLVIKKKSLLSTGVC